MNLQLFNSIAHVGLREARNAFVQTDQSAERFLHHGVAHQIVGRQRLLDHRQHEIFEPVEHVHVSKMQAAFAVNMDRLRRTFFTDEIDHADVPAGPELELQPREALFGRDRDELKKLIDRFHLVKRQPNLNRLAFSPENFVQRAIL